MSSVGWEVSEETHSGDDEEKRVLYGALDSFYQYAKVAHYNTTHLRRQSFYALPREHIELLSSTPISYLDTLSIIDECIDTNGELATAILHAGLQSFGVSQGLYDKNFTDWRGKASQNDLEKARSTIRQFYRDWSEEGQSERQACFDLVFNALNKERDSHATASPNSHMKVLVPGAGLGRLVFELCLLGYDTEGNEISFHQLLASSYILNHCPSPKFHTVYPWIQSFSNHKHRRHQVQHVLVPDLHPGATLGPIKGAGQMSMSASDFLCLYGNEDQKDSFDAVVALFFLDTAPNIIRYFEVIRNCLKTGGLLINVGPLLWHFENTPQASHSHTHDDDGKAGRMNSGDDYGIAEPGRVELTNDEVLALIEKMGFVIIDLKEDVEAPYIQDRESMIQNTYRASYWVARKK